MAAKGLAVRLSSSHAGASLAGKSVYRAAMFDRPILEGFVEVCQKMHAMPRNAPPGVVHLLLQGSVMVKDDSTYQRHHSDTTSTEVD